MIKTDFDWLVIGAGPAGIAAVGKLLDQQIQPAKIAWVDPTFTVGDFGTKWRNVPSNTKVNLFIKFLNACHSFEYAKCPHNFAIHQLDMNKTCELHYMADPLQWVTEELMKKVSTYTGYVTHLVLTDRQWQAVINDKKITSKNVILAIGAEPKTLMLDSTEIIPLDHTFDKHKLSSICTDEDVVAVFGSSHSAILIIRNLLESCTLKKVINFYHSPLRYAVYLENEILFDDTGLKGTTAEWARENIDGVLPPNLMRVLSSADTLQKHLPECTKSIHAVGFKPRSISVEGIEQTLAYDNHTGIIAPGLFGLGIAFPEAKTDRLGNTELRVGLWKFMDYLSRILPVWVEYHT